MSDYYRDRCRQGGIFSDKFIRFWWERQVVSNQYGLGGRQARNWGPDTIEGDLSAEELKNNRNDQNDDNANNHFRDDLYYASKEYNMEDIQVPILSAANLGGIALHLRGNVQGWTHAGSKFKYLRFITGRHDLPFYYPEEVEVQRSFLDAFLKGEDRVGWSKEGAVPPVDLILRRGDVGHNNPAGEKTYKRRKESAWPLEGTQYTPWYLTSDKALTAEKSSQSPAKVSYRALGSLDKPELVQFTTAAFEKETEITGHIVAHLNVSMNADADGPTPTDLDLFVTLRHLGPSGKEIYYTGTAGDPIPLCKGWLRCSFRKVNSDHAKHRSYLPHRDYLSTDVLPVLPGEVYAVDVEIWPTSVIMEKGDKLVFEVASGDTQGAGMFQHKSDVDRQVVQSIAVLLY